MTTDNVLHDKSDEFKLFEGGKLYSMLDLMGGGRAICDTCGRWQRFAALTPNMAKEDLERHGWKITIGGKDYCPKCVTPNSGEASR